MIAPETDMYISAYSPTNRTPHGTRPQQRMM